MTVLQLAEHCRIFHALYGDVPVRMDLGFDTNSLAFDLEGIQHGLFPNEDRQDNGTREGKTKECMILYPKRQVVMIGGLKLT